MPRLQVCTTMLFLFCSVCFFPFSNVCICEKVHVEARGWHKMFRSIALYFIYWDRVSHLNPELSDFTNLTGQFAQGILCFYLPSTRITGRSPYTPSIYTGAKDLNSDSHTWMARTLSAEPRPLPSFFFNQFFNYYGIYAHDIVPQNVCGSQRTTLRR